jgi:hypothetical protein
MYLTANSSNSTGLQIEGRDLKVDLSEPLPERPKMERSPQENSVFIGNLDFSVREDQIMDMCNDLVGPNTVNKVRLPVDRETGESAALPHDLIVTYFACPIDQADPAALATSTSRPLRTPSEPSRS